MNETRIKNCIFGNGEPKICVPLVGRNDEEILSAAGNILSEAKSLEEKYPNVRVDVIEFRADYYDNVADRIKLTELLSKLKELFSDRVLLFTYRSEDEGKGMEAVWRE